MHPNCIYVFDSSTANEAALAVKEGQYDSIIQYHSIKHQQMTNKQHPHQAPPMLSMHGPQPHLHPQHVSPHMMSGPPSYPAPHHVSPPNHMQPQSQHPISGVPPPPMPSQPPMQQQQPYDPNLSPEKMIERENKLFKLGQLAQLTQPPPPNIAPAPQTMHQMTNSNQSQQRSQPQHQLPQPPPHPHPHPHPQTQQQQPPPPSQQQQQQHQPPPPQQQQPQHAKQEQQQHLDPLSSMAAMSECPNMDSYGHTIHHHPPS